MSDTKENIFILTETREKKLWQDAVFVFDSSALLNFYFLPIHVRQKVFNELFAAKLKDRLWLPSHVKYEFEKNREKVIRKPITESYSPFETFNLKKIKSWITDIEGQLQDLKSKTEKDNRHPYLPQGELNNFFAIEEKFKSDFDTFEKAIKQHISNAGKEIEKVANSDDVSSAVNNLFEIGRYFHFEEIIKIVNEGEFRYRNTIPPGYEDLNDKGKKGTQIFGDLIIWKQILEYAREKKRPIIFICDDLKEDWCDGDRGRIKSPREELIKEIFDYTGVEFWMYSQPQFLFHSNQYFHIEIEQQNIDALSNLINPPTLIVKYVSWGNSQWEVRFDKLSYSLEAEGLVYVSEPRFIHHARDSNGEHSDSIINYISDAGEEWTARCRCYFDLSGRVWFRFIHNKNGESNTKETPNMRFIDWNGDKWDATLAPFNMLEKNAKEIEFICKKIP